MPVKPQTEPGAIRETLGLRAAAVTVHLPDTGARTAMLDRNSRDPAATLPGAIPMRDQSKITSLARNLTEWADRPANQRFLQREQEAVLQAAAGGLETPQVPVAAWILGTWHLGHGFCRVLRGDGRGFDEARTGQALRRCSLLLRSRNRSPDRRGTALPFSLPQAALTVLLGLALEDPNAEPLYELVRTLPDRAFKERDQLPLFARELLTLRAGRRGSYSAQLGPYQDVLLQWTGESRVLALRLATILDLHLQQVRSKGSVFEDPPSRLYPLEVIAVQKVRAWLELETPKIEQALMFTNLATMKPTGRWPTDPRVTRLERALERR